MENLYKIVITEGNIKLKSYIIYSSATSITDILQSIEKQSEDFKNYVAKEKLQIHMSTIDAEFILAVDKFKPDK